MPLPSQSFRVAIRHLFSLSSRIHVIEEVTGRQPANRETCVFAFNRNTKRHLTKMGVAVNQDLHLWWEGFVDELGTRNVRTGFICHCLRYPLREPCSVQARAEIPDSTAVKIQATSESVRRIHEATNRSDGICIRSECVMCDRSPTRAGWGQYAFS